MACLCDSRWRCDYRSVVLILLLSVFCGCDRSEPVTSVEASVHGEGLRIVTLSPHLAELVYAIGGGDLVVGVSAFTDYPAAAAELPVVGDAFNLDQERLALLEPDLLLAWDTGTPTHVVDELRMRGYRVEVVRTTSLADLPNALLRLGTLTGNIDGARNVAEAFNRGLKALESKAADAKPIRVFYQVNTHPLYTINGDHYLSEIIDTCGGQNIFADLSGLAPLISVESVLQREPEVILASSDAGPQAFVEWQRWPDMAAMQYANHFLVPANEIGRATPRLLSGATAVCDALETGRDNRRRVTND